MPNSEQDIRGTAISRLHRLGGQLRGIERLIDQNQPLPIVLQQLQAVSSATRSLMIALVEDRLEQQEDGATTLRPDEIKWVKKLLK